MTRPYAEMMADVVVDNGLAVVFSQRIDGDDPGAGKKARSGWNLIDGNSALSRNKDFLTAQLMTLHGVRNLLAATKPSGVVTIDCDTEAGLERYYELDLPQTLTIRSGREKGGYHFIHRPPGDGLEYTFFEIAGEETPQVSGASSNKLHVLAGVHKSGREYKIVGKNGLEIAPMQQEVYDRLASAYGYRSQVAHEGIQQGKRVEPSGRHDYLVSRASDYLYLGHRGSALAAHLRVDWDYGCVPEAGRDVDAEIASIVKYAERRWLGE